MKLEDDYCMQITINVIGNGPGDANIIPRCLSVTFNDAEFEVEPSLHVFNGKKFGGKSNFAIHGKIVTREMESSFKKLPFDLMRIIGTWPSSGLVTLCYLVGHFETIKVQKMDLLPSLVRPISLNPRKPLPCVFHNWLAERRFALTNLFDKCDWPQLLLPKPDMGSIHHSRPFELLMRLVDVEKNRELPQYLSEISLACWQENASLSCIQTAEHLFYLDRNVKHTDNWWLYDYQASQAMAKVHRALAWCQQELLINKVY